ncbi:MAG: hypothetical protein J2P57_21535, partial [Acidimicrobiaceae bacterium]|nr:hypothetical protein [Acidimicrobiaceae bacterium]
RSSPSGSGTSTHSSAEHGYGPWLRRSAAATTVAPRSLSRAMGAAGVAARLLLVINREPMQKRLARRPAGDRAAV